MSRMRAAVVEGTRLVVTERPEPVAQDGEVVVRVRAAGINNADLIQVRGHYPAPPGAPADIPGLECAGEVDGRRVMALLGGGGQAEAVAVDARHLLDVPEGLTWEQAGGFMEAFCTAHDALFTQGQLQPGERLLVNGAAGGVGVAAVQLGFAAGAEVTTGARHHHDELLALGAAATEVGGEYDVILELVGGDHLARDLGLLAPHGRLVVIGLGAGSRVEIEFGLLMRKRGRISSSSLRSRSADEKAEVVRRLGEHDLSRFTVPVEAAFPLEQAAEAYERFAQPGKFGKLVLLT
jgi:NADPH:quinone reductase